MKYYRKLFTSESVKSLLKDLKVTFRTSKDAMPQKNPTIGQLDFKVALIRK